MKTTIWAVHQDTDMGNRLDMFLTAAEEKALACEVMRAKGDTDVLRLLTYGSTDEAWSLFVERESQRQNYYARHEEEIEVALPECWAELLTTCKGLARMWDDDPRMPNGGIADSLRAAIAKVESQNPPTIEPATDQQNASEPKPGAKLSWKTA
jgi:hypothetical protein